ncbi:MAG: CDP-glycerol glycerophosphotransferase family protein [Planctomycetes bacterium]|nr:CDP-glycerol glycerophosphotransferase family protein [Planctomycetota bacterium]
MSTSPVKVLFSGHAPVYFLCFEPLFKKLAADPNYDVYVTGGFRQKNGDDYDYDSLSMYSQLGVSVDRILQVEQMREMDFDVLFCSNTKMLEPASVKKKVQVFHGISFRNRAIRPANMGADAFLMIGPYMERKFREAGLIGEDDSRVVRVGLMKNDAMFDGTLSSSIINEQWGFDGTRPVIAFCPTGQKHNALDRYGIELLKRLDATGKYDILVKLHDHPHGSMDWTPEIERIQNKHMRLVESFAVTPVLYAADLLITDASSVSNEYLVLDRPIIYMDTPELIERAFNKKDSMTDLSTWGRRTGTVADSIDSMLDCVTGSLANPGEMSEIRQEAAADLFFRKSDAAHAAYMWLNTEFAQSSANPKAIHA